MAKNSPRHVRITREITYHPPGTLAWFRTFREGWEGPVTEPQYKFLMSEGAAVSLKAQAPDHGAAP